MLQKKDQKRLRDAPLSIEALWQRWHGSRGRCEKGGVEALQALRDGRVAPPMSAAAKNSWWAAIRIRWAEAGQEPESEDEGESEDPNENTTQSLSVYN